MQKLNSDVVNQAMTFEKSCAKLKEKRSKTSKSSVNKGGLSSSDDEELNPKDISKLKKPLT